MVGGTTPWVLAEAAPVGGWTWLGVATCIVVILASSMWMFVGLVRRWETRRRWTSLAEWARAEGFRIAAPVPEVVQALVRPGLQAAVSACVSNGTTTFVELTERPGGAPPADGVAVIARRWHLMIRPASWRHGRTVMCPAGSRAATPGGEGARQADVAARALARGRSAAAGDVLTWIDLGSMMTSGGTERFAFISADDASGLAMMKSHWPGQTPPDIGVVLIDGQAVFDFTGRAFDGIELNRMILLGERQPSA